MALPNSIIEAAIKNAEKPKYTPAQIDEAAEIMRKSKATQQELPLGGPAIATPTQTPITSPNDIQLNDPFATSNVLNNNVGQGNIGAPFASNLPALSTDEKKPAITTTPATATAAPATATKKEGDGDGLPWWAALAGLISSGAQGYRGGQGPTVLDKYAESEREKQAQQDAFKQKYLIAGANARRSSSGKMLSPSMQTEVNDTKNTYDMFNNFKNYLNTPTAQNVIGPVKGAFGGINPYSKEAQDFNAKSKLVAQVLGKQLEGGKLTDEDILRYQKMLPTITDTKETVANKMANVDSMLRQNIVNKHAIIKSSGYDTAGLEWMPGATASSSQSQGGTVTIKRSDGKVFQVSPEQAKMLQQKYGNNVQVMQ